jgi:predicted O-methyltransferase YrrM
MRPWFVHNSIFWLEGRIQPDWRCFEWGSGWSTIWLAEQATYVASVEHDPEWYEKVSGWIKQYGFTDSARLTLCSLDNGYAGVISYFEDDYFDLVEIDGRRRADCLVNALPKLKPGGLLVVDNSEREQYQASLALVKPWESVDFHSGHSDGQTTSVYFKPKG